MQICLLCFEAFFSSAVVLYRYCDTGIGTEVKIMATLVYYTIYVASTHF